MVVEIMTSESPSRQITVVDVYDLAATIGKDFEAIIDTCGTESVKNLMPKVISALETLEALASRNERENEEITTLTGTLHRLEVEKKEKREDRIKFEQEMEQTEDNYKQEVKELWEMIQKLQAENRKLDSSSSADESYSNYVREDELKVMLQLQSTVDLQRRNLKQMSLLKEEQINQMETLSQQNEKLTRVNKELSRKYKSVQNQGRALVEEKAELLANLHTRDCGMQQLQSKLGETEKAKKDLEQAQSADEGQSPVRSLVHASPTTKSTLAASPRSVKAEESLELDRDNAPRFTLAELREVLQEKNSLKARVLELEEELASLRPAPTPSPAFDEDDLPVYGPMPREPDEKLYPWKFQRKESGIRSFLTGIWHRRAKGGEEMGSGSTSSSSLSKPISASSKPKPKPACSSSVASQPVGVSKRLHCPDVTWHRQEDEGVSL